MRFRFAFAMAKMLIPWFMFLAALAPPGLQITWHWILMSLSSSYRKLSLTERFCLLTAETLVAASKLRLICCNML